MDDFDNEVEHPKKRRRRFANQNPVSAHLTFDENLREDVAVLSGDLWSELVSGTTHFTFSQVSRTHYLQNQPKMEMALRTRT